MADPAGPKWSVAGILFLTGLFGLIDWVTGYELNFFAFYFIPVGLAAWRLGRGPAFIFSVLASFVWYVANTDQVYSSPVFAVWNTIIRLASFMIIGWTLYRIRELLEEERRTSESLRRTLAEIKLLEGLLPICADCKKIRTDTGEWQQMEVYIGRHSNAQFSHGYCPACLKKALKEAGIAEPQV
jgi:hypothetical protein